MKYFLIALLTAATDLLTKSKIKKKYPVGRKKQIKGKLYFWHIKNKGIAYNKLENEPKKVTVISSAISAVLALYLIYLIKSDASFGEKFGISLFLGGGLGNLIDRIINKEVTDFIYIKAKKAPIFNLADVAALFGGIITVIETGIKG